MLNPFMAKPASSACQLGLLGTLAAGLASKPTDIAALMNRQQDWESTSHIYPGTDTITSTVYVTLTPGASETAGQMITGQPVGGILTVTVFVTEDNVPPTTTSFTTLSPPIQTSFTTLSPAISVVSTTPSPSPTTNYATQTSFQSPAAQSANVAYESPADDWDAVCGSGDTDERVGGGISPTPEGRNTLIACGIYFMAILVAWNFLLLRTLLYPVKLLVTAIHEFGHCAAAVLAGARLEQVMLDPSVGGYLTIAGGVYPLAALPAGFLMSILVGAAFTFAGFDCLASKIASFFLGLIILSIVWWAAGFLTKLLTLSALGLMIGLWFIDHARWLRYGILFIGVASSFYVIWDTIDDLVFRKPNPCCARLFNLAIPRTPAHVFALIGLGVSIAVFVLVVIGGLAAFRETTHGE